jgi:hypothetical protein
MSPRTLLAVALACGLFAGALIVPSAGRAGTAKPCKHGFVKKHGRCVKAPKPAPPTPAPATPAPSPPPVAQDGHYVGTTSNLTSITFDVSLGGAQVTNLVTGQINESCNPPDSLYGGGIANGSANVATDGSFSMSNPSYDEGPLDGFDAVGHLSLQGQLSGMAASGTLNQGLSFGPYVCDSGVVTWTAALTH